MRFSPLALEMPTEKSCFKNNLSNPIEKNNLIDPDPESARELIEKMNKHYINERFSPEAAAPMPESNSVKFSFKYEDDGSELAIYVEKSKNDFK